MVILVAGAVSTGILFVADAFLAFTGWRVLGAKSPTSRLTAGVLCRFAERRELPVAAVAMGAALFLALHCGAAHPRAACLAGGALVALAGHLIVYVKTACLLQQLAAAPLGSAEWVSRGARVEAAMLTRASLQAAAFICFVTSVWMS